jgi:hypothetical protein
MTMGYYVNQGDSRFWIRAEKIPAAFEALKALGSAHSWVSADADKAQNFEELIQCWRWSVYHDKESGDIDEICFDGEKYGDEEWLFDAIGPYVEAGSYINLQGEDGCVWRFYFNGSEAFMQDGITIFRDGKISGYLDLVANALDMAERRGSAEDNPEGSRYITLSDTLARQIASHLRDIKRELGG